MDKRLAIKIFSELLKELNLNPKQLSDSLGKERPQWAYDILNENKKVGISKNIAEQICAKFPQINKSWLLTGEGSMLKSDNASNKDPNEVFLTTNSGTKYYELSNGYYKMRVPLVPYNAYGRYISGTNEAIPMDRDEWEEVDFVVDRISHGRYLAFEIKGDSMDDDSRRSFVQGDVVLARELDRTHWMNKLHYRDYPYWIVVTDDTILCKQIIDHNIETGMITFHSLNPSREYSDFMMHVDEIRQLFNIIARTSTSF